MTLCDSPPQKSMEALRVGVPPLSLLFLVECSVLSSYDGREAFLRQHLS